MTPVEERIDHEEDARKEIDRVAKVIASYDDPDDKLTIAIGNFNRVVHERASLARRFERLSFAAREGEAVLDGRRVVDPQEGARIAGRIREAASGERRSIALWHDSNDRMTLPVTESAQPEEERRG